MKYLLDSDICIFALKDKFNIIKKIENVGVENCYVSEITILELTYGALNSQQIEKHRDEVVKIEELYSIVPIYAAKEHFALEKTRLRRAGNLIPDFDLLIGCSSVANDMIMVTRNVEHLGRIDGIQIEDWTKKEYNKFIDEKA